MSDKMSGLDRANMWKPTAGHCQVASKIAEFVLAKFRVLARDIVKVLHIDLLQVYVS